MPRSSSIESEIEEMLHQGSQHMESRIILAGIPEKEDAILPYPAIQPIEKEQVSDELNVSKSVMNVTAPGVMDQEVNTAKRASDSNRAAKKQRVDDLSLTASRKSQELVNDADQMDAGEKRKTIAVPDIQMSKLHQNIAPWKEHTPNENVTTMLQNAGLADLLPKNSAVSISSESSRRDRSSCSESSTDTLASLDRTEMSDWESMESSDSELFERSEHSRRERSSGSESSTDTLASLDRTEMSDWESMESSDSELFERQEWGTKDTIRKIVSLIQDYKTIKFEDLIHVGSGIDGPSKHKVSRCFMSLLKLKYHGFIKITKDPKTLEIVDIALGPKFD